MSALLPLLLVALGQAHTTTVAEAEWLDEVIAGRRELPALHAVQEAAVSAMDIPSGDDARGWARRSRIRGAVPQLDVGAGTDVALTVRDAYSDAHTLVTSSGQGLAVHVAARWTLGDLVFNDIELRANREALARAAAVRLIRDRVTRLYFERVAILARQRKGWTTELAIEAARLDGLLNAYISKGER